MLQRRELGRRLIAIALQLRQVPRACAGRAARLRLNARPFRLIAESSLTWTHGGARRELFERRLLGGPGHHLPGHPPADRARPRKPTPRRITHRWLRTTRNAS